MYWIYRYVSKYFPFKTIKMVVAIFVCCGVGGDGLKVLVVYPVLGEQKSNAP